MSIVTNVTYGPSGIVSWEEADETFHIEYLNGKPITILSNGGPWLKEACSISYDAQGNFTGFSREIKTPMLPQILAMARGTVTATTNLTGGIEFTGPGNYRKVVYPNVSVAIGLAPNVTWNNTAGGFTSPTDLGVTYSRGLWLYFNGVGINGTTGGPATSGYYWCIMSSTTQGVAYAEKFDPTLGSIPKRVANPTALITVTGANAPTLNAYIAAVQRTVKGGSIGANGILTGRDYLSYNNSATLKSSIVTFSSTTLISNNAGGSFSTQRGARREYTLYNIGFEDRNLSQQNTYIGAVATQAALGSIDTAVDQQMTYILSTSSATDFILFNSISLSSENT